MPRAPEYNAARRPIGVAASRSHESRPDRGDFLRSSFMVQRYRQLRHPEIHELRRPATNESHQIEVGQKIPAPLLTQEARVDVVPVFARLLVDHEAGLAQPRFPLGQFDGIVQISDAVDQSESFRLLTRI